MAKLLVEQGFYCIQAICHAFFTAFFTIIFGNHTHKPCILDSFPINNNAEKTLVSLLQENIKIIMEKYVYVHNRIFLLMTT